MKVRLAYGKEGLWVELPDDNVTVVEPRFVPGLPDETEAIRSALREPIGAPPLRDLVKRGDTVAIVFSDITRPQPRERMLPVLLEELAHVPPENIVLINALGTHPGRLHLYSDSPQTVILRSGAEPVLSKAEGKNLVLAI